jgi:tetratricopeptide (TPR) repeat protein
VNPSDEVRDALDIAVADAEASRDPRSIWDAWGARSVYTYLMGDLEESIAEQQRALDAALRTGDGRLVLETQQGLLTMALVGPTPCSEVVAMAEDLLARAAMYPPARADALRLVAPAEAMLGRFEDARRHIAEALAIDTDLHRPWECVHIRLDMSWVERVAGDLDAADRVIRRSLEDIEQLGDQTMVAFAASRLAVVLVAQGRHDEALPFIALGESVPSVTNHSRVIGARARIRAAAGDGDARVDVASMLEPLASTAFVNVKADALVDAGEVEAELGDPAAAVRFFEEALDLCARKENLVLASQLRARIADLSAAASPVA